ncbi:MAG: hypothetical protein NTV38_07030 [Chloroflexi bacterium]|nr:hypothetical protein [Chloroflexota bacterium]
MNTKMKQFAEASMGKITSLENRLSGVLRPIKPRKEFIHGVAHRIQRGTQVAFVDRIANWHIIAMLIAGLISLAVFLAVVGRVLLSLLGKKRTARAYR